MPPIVLFNPENHTYTVDGRPVPSVTRILGPLYDFSKVPADLLAAAGAYGRNAHTMAALELRGELDEQSLDPELAGPLAALHAWIDDNDALFSASLPIIEKPLCHARKGYAGTPDLIFDGLAVVDWKTRAFSPIADPLQLFGYEDAHVASGGTRGKYRRLIVELRRDGTYKETVANRANAPGMFAVMLEHFKRNLLIEQYKQQAH